MENMNIRRVVLWRILPYGESRFIEKSLMVNVDYGELSYGEFSYGKLAQNRRIRK